MDKPVTVPVVNFTLRALQLAERALKEAMDVHIYDADNGEKPEPGCQYVEALEELRFAIKLESLKERQRQSDALEALSGLVAWESYMGGFDAKPWKDAKRLLKKARDAELKAMGRECAAEYRRQFGKDH